MGGEKIYNNSVLSKLIIAVLVYFLVSLTVFAQTENNQIIEEQTSFSQYQNESNLVLENPENQFLFSTEQEKMGLWPFIRMILVLAVVIGGIYLVFFFIKKSKGGASANDAFLKKAATLVLSPGKSIYVITLLDKAYLVGAAESSINLLGEIQDKELVDTLNLNAEREPENRAPDFASLLSLFMPKQKTKQEEKNEFLFK